MKSRQNNTVGLAVNKTYGLFLYCGEDTHQNALICLDAVELQKGKTDVLFSGILIYFVTQFINLQLNVRTEHIFGPAQHIFTFSGNKSIS